MLLDTSSIQVDSEHTLELLLADSNDVGTVRELAVDVAEETQKPNTSLELLMGAVDSLCVDRFADMKTLNRILNELDSFPVSWAENVYMSMAETVEFVQR